jgi:hypothetical protein
MLCYYSQSRTCIGLKTTTCLCELPDETQMIISRICRMVAKTYTLLQDYYCSDTIHYCTVQYTVQYRRAELFFPVQVYLKPYILISRRLFLAILLSVARRLDTPTFHPPLPMGTGGGSR